MAEMTGLVIDEAAMQQANLVDALFNGGAVHDWPVQYSSMEVEKRMGILERMRQRITERTITGAAQLNQATVTEEPKSELDFDYLIKQGVAVAPVDAPAKITALTEYRKSLCDAGMGHNVQAVDKQIVIVEKKQRIAEHGYISISQKKIDAFISRKNNETRGLWRYHWDEKKVETSPHLPPAKVLAAIKESKDRQVFDYLTIASVEMMPDPIVFGRLTGSDEHFFIAQWGDDVCLDDII